LNHGVYNFTASNGAGLGGDDSYFLFDGTNDVVNSNIDYTFGSDDFTLSIWVNNNDHSGTHVVLANRIGTSNRFSFYLDNAGILNVYTSGTTSVGLAGSTALTDDTWYYVTFVRDDNVGYIYLNGDEDSTGAVSTGNLGTNPVQVGHENGGAVINGFLSDLKIFNRVLTSTEVSDLYDEGRNYNPVGIQNFTASARNEWSDAIINNFTITVIVKRNTTLSVSGGKVINIFFNSI